MQIFADHFGPRCVFSTQRAVNLDTSTSRGHTGKFSPVTGNWVLYLTLGLCPEIAVVGLYTLTRFLSSCCTIQAGEQIPRSTQSYITLQASLHTMHIEVQVRTQY